MGPIRVEQDRPWECAGYLLVVLRFAAGADAGSQLAMARRKWIDGSITHHDDVKLLIGCEIQGCDSLKEVSWIMSNSHISEPRDTATQRHKAPVRWEGSVADGAARLGTVKLGNGEGTEGTEAQRRHSAL